MAGLSPDAFLKGVTAHEAAEAISSISKALTEMGVTTREPERDYWLLSEALKQWRTYDMETVYEFADGTRHTIADHFAVSYKGDPANIRVRKAGVAVDTDTLNRSMWKPFKMETGAIGGLIPVGVTGTTTGAVTFSTGAHSMDEMRVIAGTQTPRQWLDQRVSEIAEQGRL